MMNIKNTQKYYEELEHSELCQCNYCINYVQEIKRSYPLLAKHLATMGIDIEKPFETMPLEVDENNKIEYISAQYIILGSSNDFTELMISDVQVNLAISHPSTGLKAEHFVIEVSPITLQWVCD